MNREQIILSNIDKCIKNTKIFFDNDTKFVRNISKAINGLNFINNIKNYYYIPALNNNNSIKKLSNMFNLNLNNYFNEFNTWFLFPEKELCLIVPISILNIVEPNYIWNNTDSFNSPIKITSKVWCPVIKQIMDTPQIIILKTPIGAIFIGDTNNTLESLINNLNLPEW